MKRTYALLCTLLALPAFAATKPAKTAVIPEHSVTGPACSGATAPTELHLMLGKSTLMRLPEPVANRSLGNPAVAQAMLVSPDTLYLVGMDLGSTNLIVQGRSGNCHVVEITVGIDASGVQGALAVVLPEERQIKVQTMNDAVILTGVVSNVEAVARAQEVVQAFVKRPVRAVNSKKNEDSDGQKGPSSGSAGDSRVVNLLTVIAAQQVMLEVKVAEVSKGLLERVEADTALKLASGSWLAVAGANHITGQLKTMLGLAKSNGNKVDIAAQNENNLVRVLAEPNVMALSGQEGSFLSGGRFYIPVDVDNQGRVRLEEKEFGIGLRFRPTVMAGGRIQLYVAPEVSELSKDGVGIQANGTFGQAIIPVVTARRASTTVQLQDGQSFVIGGLIKNNLVAKVKAFPFLGEIPILGALFRSTDYQNDRTELVFVVTPHLVKPIDGPVRLPTDEVAPAPSDVHLRGSIEPKTQP